MQLCFLLLFVALASCQQFFNVKNFGAIGDGKTKDTLAIEKALASCTMACTVYFPTGTYLTAPFNLTVSNLLLELAPSAIDDYFLIEPLPSYGSGREHPGPRYVPCLMGYKISNVTIRGGTFDGQGAVWWAAHHEHKIVQTRPHLVEIMYGTDITIVNATFLNSPFWTIHPVYCDRVRIAYSTVNNPVGSPNTDGIDPDSSSNVIIEHCFVYAGDDHISIKSGYQYAGRMFNRPSENITIVNNYFGLGGGVAIGSETAGSVRNVTVAHNRYFGAGNVVRMKTARGNGGVVENIYYEHERLEAVAEAIFFNMNYHGSPTPTNESATPIFRNIFLRDIVGVSAKAGSLKCLPESPCSISLQDIELVSVKPYDCENVNATVQHVIPGFCKKQ